MVKPKVLILSGYGINCEEETAFAFRKAGASPEIVHINDLIEKNRLLRNYQILVFPGGFSYGDDTGAGNALANRIKNHLRDDLLEFIHRDKLVLGICNGFQVLVNLGLVPALDGQYGSRQAALVDNTSARYLDRWVDLAFSPFPNTIKSPWTKDITRISLPIAHGEGRFYAEPEVIERIKQKGLIAARYSRGEMCTLYNLPANPNGSLENIAGITDKTGKVLGMMPHPERAIHYTHYPDWTARKLELEKSGRKISEEGDGNKIFTNGVDYFR